MRGRSLVTVTAVAVVVWLAFLYAGSDGDTRERALEPAAESALERSSSGALAAPEPRSSSSDETQRRAETAASNAPGESSLEPDETDVAPFAMRFRVIERESALPIAGAALTPRDMREDEGPLVTDEHGDASCAASRRERRAVFEVTAEGYALALVGVDARKANWNEAVVVELSRSATLSGRVRGLAAGASHELILATSDVALLQGHRQEWSRLESPQWRAPIDESGGFVLTGLPPRAPLYASWVEGRQAGDRLQAEPLLLEPGELRVVEWDLAPSCAVTGRVVDAAGNALSDVAVEARRGTRPEFYHAAPSNLPARVFTDERGAYRIAGLLPEGYVIGIPVVHDHEPVPQYAALRHTASLSGGDELPLPDLVAYQAAHVRGRLLRVDGRPQRSATVVARQDDALYYDETDGNGNFDIGMLVPGEYEVFAGVAELSKDVAPDPVRVTAPIDDLELRLIEGAVVTGSIVDPRTGDVLDGFAAIQRNGEWATTLDEGRGGPRFRFGGLAAGRYHLIVESADGRAGIRMDVEVGAGARVDHLEVPVGSTGELRVTTGTRANVFSRVLVGDVLIPEFSSLGSGDHRYRPPVGSVVVQLIEHGGSSLPENWRTLDSRTVGIVEGETVVVAFD